MRWCAQASAQALCTMCACSLQAQQVQSLRDGGCPQGHERKHLSWCVVSDTKIMRSRLPTPSLAWDSLPLPGKQSTVNLPVALPVVRCSCSPYTGVVRALVAALVQQDNVVIARGIQRHTISTPPADGVVCHNDVLRCASYGAWSFTCGWVVGGGPQWPRPIIPVLTFIILCAIDQG